ncbi:Hypothetical protein A7982_06340 [Minicystis rosea]|nr:Hypothetical protein A7982_06340 [Minicystis rosea]
MQITSVDRLRACVVERSARPLHRRPDHGPRSIFRLATREDHDEDIAHAGSWVSSSLEGRAFWRTVAMIASTIALEIG